MAAGSRAAGLYRGAYLVDHGPERSLLGRHQQVPRVAVRTVAVRADEQRPAPADFHARALLASAVLLALAYWVALFVPSFAPKLVSRRISAGFVLAVCAFLVLMRARGQARPWPARALGCVPGPDGSAGHGGAHGPRRSDRAGVVWRVAPQPAALALGGRRGKPAAGVDVRHELRRDADTTHPGNIRWDAARRAGRKFELHGDSHGTPSGGWGRGPPFTRITGAGFANYAAVHQQAARDMNSPEGSAAAYVLANMAKYLRIRTTST